MNKARVFFLVTLFLISATSVLAEEADPKISEQNLEETAETNTEEEENEETFQKPQIEGKFQVRQVGQTVNYDSLLNPDNEALELKESRRTVSIYAQISDYFDEEKSTRWMFKAYAYSLYEVGNDDDDDSDRVRIDEYASLPV